MTAEELWREFTEATGTKDKYTAWAFCDGGEIGDELANLVLEGKKTATASSLIAYQTEGEEIPKVGCYSAVLFDSGEAACIIRNTAVNLVPFCEVSPRHAYKEGEGDRSLAYWRRVHEEFFTPDYEAAGLPFDRQGLCVLEEFAVVWLPGGKSPKPVFELRKMTEEDAKAIIGWKYEGEYAVYNYPPLEECISRGWGIASEEKRKTNYRSVYVDGELFGFLNIMLRDDCVELGIGINPECCGRHFGRDFIEFGAKTVKDLYPNLPIHLLVRPFNVRALRCYETAGFAEIGRSVVTKFTPPEEMVLLEKK